MGKIADLFVKLGLKNKDFDQGLDKSEKKVSAFSKTIGKIGGLIAGAFAVSQITDFTKEVVKLSAEAEGVEKAFNRIGGQDVLADIQKATRGTVSNLELMRKTVSAQQLGVPIQNLAKLFEFATQRAADTGESVDYLVNSIVVGIGRKSPLILDNLGISAIALKEKLNGVGLGTASVGDVAEAVGKIASESMAKIGNSATTNGQKIQSFAATWDNLKLSIGRVITTSKEFKAVAAFLGLLNLGLNKVDSSQAKIEEGAKRLFNAWDKQGKITKKFADERIKALKKENAELLRSDSFSEKSTRDRRKGNLELIKLFKDRLKVIDEESKGNIKVAETINIVKKQIENLEKERDDASSKNRSRLNAEIKSLKNYKDLLLLTGTEEKKRFELKTEADLPTLKKQEVSGSGINKIGQIGALGQLDEVFDTTQRRQSEILASQQDFNDQMNGMVEDFTTGAVVSFAEGLGALFSGDIGMDGFINNIISTIGSFLVQMGEMLIAYGIAMDAFKKAFSNPFAAIAAGVALVAIGSAISRSASSGPGGSSSGVGAVTSIDTRGTSNTSGSLQQVEVQPVTVMVEGEIKNSVIALSNIKGQKQLAR